MVNLLEGCAARWCVALMAKLLLLVVGAGGHGRLVAQAAELSLFFPNELSVEGVRSETFTLDQIRVLGSSIKS